jgi:predicted HicB family RNase H-like nuclease
MTKIMNDTLTYKGFIGSVHFSADDGVFFGKLEGINDLITFEGKTVNDLTNAFYYVIEEHIKDCQKENIPLEKSYKGSFNIRVSPDLHRKLAVTARSRGKSMNLFLNEVLNHAVL